MQAIQQRKKRLTFDSFWCLCYPEDLAFNKVKKKNKLRHPFLLEILSKMFTDSMISGVCFKVIWWEREWNGWGNRRKDWPWIGNVWRWVTGVCRLIILFDFTVCLTFSEIKLLKNGSISNHFKNNKSQLSPFPGIVVCSIDLPKLMPGPTPLLIACIWHPCQFDLTLKDHLRCTVSMELVEACAMITS